MFHRGRKLADPGTNTHVAKRGSYFLYVTREEGLGMITVTDFVTELLNANGGYGGMQPGTGFRRGVRFNISYIAR